MKKRSGRNLIRFFYHLLVVLVMAMPMLSGLVRIVYVQANHNAFESYSGQVYETIQPIYYQSNEVNQFTDLLIGNLYEYQYGVTSTQMRFSISYFMPLSFSVHTKTITTGTTNNRIVISDYNNIHYFEYYHLDNGQQIVDIYQNLTALLVYANDTTNLDIYNYLHYTDAKIVKEYVEVEQQQTLDNVFDYSIWKTMEEFTFHSDFRFTDIANGMLMTFDNNNLYIQYINFYINWVLTCAVISFAPYVLLTFYHLAIGLLDKFMKKGDDL